MVVELDGKPVSFAVALPNLFEIIGDLDGRLLPFGLARLIPRFRKHKYKSGKLLLLGTRKELQNSATGGAILMAIIEELRRRSLETESNISKPAGCSKTTWRCAGRSKCSAASSKRSTAFTTSACRLERETEGTKSMTISVTGMARIARISKDAGRSWRNIHGCANCSAATRRPSRSPRRFSSDRLDRGVSGLARPVVLAADAAARHLRRRLRQSLSIS